MRSQICVISLLFVGGLFFQSCEQDPSGDGGIFQVFNNNNVGAAVTELEYDVVTEWTELLLEIERYATGMRPTASARSFAYIYLASYETAVPGIDGQVSLQDRLRGFNISYDQLPDEIDWELALNSCFATCMEHFIYNIPASSEALIGALEEDLEDEYASRLSDDIVDESKAWGRYVANQVIEYSQTDRDAERQITDPQPLSYDPPIGDGLWYHSADADRSLFPYWGSVRTFVISPDETSTVPPIDYSENPRSAYFAEMEECYEASNAAKEEDGEQLWIAEFWSDDVEGLMFSPPARQLAIANQLVERFDLDLGETLSLYLKMGFSLNDAAVATWEYKYEYNVMRPNEYIHEFIDPDFQTNLYTLVWWPNPGFPGYPSGHSAFASAAAGVFIDFFGNSINFTDRSHQGRSEFRGDPRTFSSFEEMAEENAFSRIPLGVHMRMDCTEGLRLGYEIADAINSLDLTENSQTTLAANP